MNKTLTILAVVFGIIGCGRNQNIEQQYMIFDDVRNVIDIPCRHQLIGDSMVAVAIDDTYIEDFAIYDSLLIIDTNQEHDILDIISLSSMQSKGRLLNKGNADGEFSAGVDISMQSTIYTHADSIYINAFDFMKQKIFTANITKVMDGQDPEIRKMPVDCDYPRPVFWVKTIADSIVYLRSSADLETKQNRHKLSVSGELRDSNVDKLNNFEIPSGEDINILSTLISVSPDGRKIVEAPLGMNYINVYSLSDDKAFTICLGDKMIALDDITDLSKFNRPYMFSDLRAYDFGFAVLKLDTTDLKYQSGLSDCPTLLFFDWDGQPLDCIKSDFHYSLFDYDAKSKELYLLDNDGRLLKKPLSIND